MVAVGDGFACVLVKDGTVSCWGRNDLGQLGRDPATTPSCGSFPCSPTPKPVADLVHVVRITAGDDFACALDADHNVWCWGSNAKGQLESTPGSTSFTAKKVITDVADVVASAAHACVLMSDKGVRCWGENTCNIWGSTGPAIRTVADLINIPDMTQVALGRDAMCGIAAANGRTLCWGADHHGSLGHDLAPEACGALQADPIPKAVQVQDGAQLPIADVADVHVGDGLVCARRTNGTVACWGDNSRGGLGQGIADPTSHARAIDLPALIATELTVGGQTVCTITANRLLCWGDSTTGQLETLTGNAACGNQSCRALGYAISNMGSVRDMTVGASAVGAIKDDLSLWMWGKNTAGNLAVAPTDSANVSCGAAGVCITSPRQVQGLPALN
jgi:hypothetical protein